MRTGWGKYLWRLSLYASLSIHSIAIQSRQNSVSLSSLGSLRSFAFEESNSQIPALSAIPFLILLLTRGGRIRPAKPKTMRASSKHEEMNLELAIKTLGVPKKEAGKYVANLWNLLKWMCFVKMLSSGGHLKIFGQNPDKSHVGIYKTNSPFKIWILKSVDVWKNLKKKL